MEKSLYNDDAARSREQLRRMQDLAERDVCAFCPEHLGEETDSPVLLETDHWTVKPNDWPYEGTELHLLLIAKQHASTFGELTEEACRDFGPTIAKVEESFGLFSYAGGWRGGDPSGNGGSVWHLHSHIIVADPSANKDVKFRMSSKETG